MKCKYCEAQWEEDTLICPECGKSAEAEGLETAIPEETEQIPENEGVELPEEEAVLPVQQEAPKAGGVKWWKILLIALAGAALGTVLTVLIMMGCGVELFPTEPTQDPSQGQVVTYDTYFADTETVKAQNSQIVATAGENTLTNGRFQVYYWSTFVTFLQNNGMYYFDISQPLANQFMSADVSWEEYFVDNSINNWHCYAVLCQQAKQEGFTLAEDVQEYLDGLPEYLETIALENGCENGQDLVEQQFGPGATVADYIAYMNEYTLAMEYYNYKYENIQPTEEELNAYFTEHEQEFAAKGITRDSKLVNVRHILIQFESESGASEYTEQEKENCKNQAQAILDQWLAGDATEESFGLLAQEHSKDPGSASKGGLYEDVAKNYMTANFDAWIFDETREFGDYGLVETEYGYHVMFFAGSTLQWPEAAKTNLIAQQMQDMMRNAMETWPSETKFDNLAIGNIDLGI